ncbi:MAG: hypothetical protein LBP33_12135 [Candidatus Adiutrix sp.]|jgi:nucleoside phosphorylase|nr:hypothetical protein [Candidatus Adiutrix sp.]
MATCLTGGGEGGRSTDPAGKEVLVFTPTPNEYQAVKRRVAETAFSNIKVRVLESGPGKINAAFKMAAEVLPGLARGHRPAFLVGAGTAGSLNLEMASGDLIASTSCVISDWRMEDGRASQHGAYGQFVYEPLSAGLAESIALNCLDRTASRLMEHLGAQGFKRGRLMTSDTFVAGREHKLSLGRDFAALACDMESGAFAFTAQNLLGGLPWFNLRIVADSLDQSLADYFSMEIDLVEILGARTAEALQALDRLI